MPDYKQLSEEAVKQGKKTISYSQISLYNSCPYQWKVKYIDGLKDPPNIHTVFGSAIHEAIQEYLKVCFTISAKKADEIDFETYFLKVFKDTFIKEAENHPLGMQMSNKKEFNEFYEDGLEILNYLRKRRTLYFSSRDTKLLAIEKPLLYPIEGNDNLLFMGFIDMVVQDDSDHRIKIIDFKTSTRGWKDDQKKDINKIAQLLLYKKYYAKQYFVSYDHIDTEFLILKRKLLDYSPYPQKRFQVINPASGTRKIKEVDTLVTNFLESFGADGLPKPGFKYMKNPGDACKYCPFNKPDLCDKRN